MSKNPTFDLKGFAQWAADKAISHAEERTALPLGDLLKPAASDLITRIGLGSVELDPVMVAMGRIVWAGMERQRKLEEAKAERAKNAG